MDLSPSELSHQLDFTAGVLRQLEFPSNQDVSYRLDHFFQAQLRVAANGVLLLPPPPALTRL